MKATDLMLGDWVYGLYPSGKRYEVPFRISAIDTYPSNRSPRIITFGGYGFQEEHLEPIPLTPEILEKNGFEKTHCGCTDVYTYSDDNEYYALAINEYTDSIWRAEYTNCEFNFPLCRIMVCYIHELQRALRCYGLKELAHNFKI